MESIKKNATRRDKNNLIKNKNVTLSNSQGVCDSKTNIFTRKSIYFERRL